VSSYDNTQPEQKAYASTTIKRRIKLAREVQRARYIKTSFGDCNAAVPDRAQFEEFTPHLEPHVSQFVGSVFRKLDTKRMEVKVLLVARTIADYEESRLIRIGDVKEAVDLMGLDHNYFRSLSG
jgi:predicted ATPase with chaperone activity